MEELEILTLEDKDYAVIDRIENNGVEYVYLANIDDENDFFVKKQGDPDTLLGLEDDEELNLSLNLFAQKHKDDPEI